MSFFLGISSDPHQRVSNQNRGGWAKANAARPSSPNTIQYKQPNRAVQPVGQWYLNACACLLRLCLFFCSGLWFIRSCSGLPFLYCMRQVRKPSETASLLIIRYHYTTYIVQFINIIGTGELNSSSTFVPVWIRFLPLAR